jgi:hypothetical protein
MENGAFGQVEAMVGFDSALIGIVFDSSETVRLAYSPSRQTVLFYAVAHPIGWPSFEHNRYCAQ